MKSNSRVANIKHFCKVYEKQSTQAILDSTIKHLLPIAVIKSNCSGNTRGMQTLRGFSDVVTSKEDASEFLFRFFERGVEKDKACAT